nr:VWA domain-containing protein [Cohaesibacter haloalkalitolerans]
MSSTIRENLVNRYNISSPSIGLDGVYDVHSVQVEDRTYVYAAGSNSDAIVIFELRADGELTYIKTVVDDSSLVLNGASSLASAVVGTDQYLFVQSFYDESISVFRIGDDGDLTAVDQVVDDATLALSNDGGKMAVAVAGGQTYLIAAGGAEDGVSVFRVATDGTLTNTDNVFDADELAYGLDRATHVESAVIGGVSYVFVTGNYENAVNVFRLNANGTLALTDSLVDEGDLELYRAADMATAVIGGVTYLFVGGNGDAGVSVFSVDAAGTLTNVFNLSDSTLLSNVEGLETFEMAGDHYLVANGYGYDRLSYYKIGTDGSLTLADSLVDDTFLSLNGSAQSTFATIDGHTYIISSGQYDDGLSTFEVGLSNLPINGTNDADILTGTELDDEINGLGGNDIIMGDDDDDTLSGDGGDDVVDGGSGNDKLFGDGLQTQTISNTVTVPSTQQQLSLTATLPSSSNASEIEISGYISRASLQTTDFNIVYVIDVSGSMSSSFVGTETVGDLNGDGSSNTLLDGAIASYEAMTKSLIDAGVSGSDLAIVSFSDYAYNIYNSTVYGDVSGALRSLNDLSGTNFEAGLQYAISALKQMGSGENRVFFLSDGANNFSSSTFADEVATLLDPTGLNAEIRSVGLGMNADVEGGLDLLDDGIDNSSAERVLTPSELTAGLSGTPVETSEVARIEVLVNGHVVRTILPTSFTSTPFGLQYNATVSGLSTTANDVVTVRMVASDAAATTAQASVTLSNAPSDEGDDVLLGHEGDDTLYGNGGDDRLLGGDGSDVLFGGAGNDVLDGGRGIDRMEGGAGDDTYYVNLREDTVFEGWNAGTDRVFAGVSYRLWEHSQNIENLILTGTANLNGAGNGLNNGIVGNSGHNNLDGGYGNDTMIGGAGNDTLNGGAGADSMNGGTGNDTYYVDNVGDKVIEAFNGGMDRVLSSVSYRLWEQSQNIENLILTGTANINGSGNGLNNGIVGNSGNNYLEGGNGNDTLLGGAGNDTLDGGTGADSMNGGAGNDTYYVDNAGDTITEAINSGSDRVFSSVSYRLWEQSQHIENLILTGTANINGSGNGLNNGIVGNSGNNYLEGGYGNDTLLGGAGNDTLDGGTGADSMNGGAGNDTYYVDNAGDTITEAINSGSDRVFSSVSYRLWEQSQHIENLILTGTANIDGAGNGMNNGIVGNSGNNYLEGGNGNDSLLGGAGNDTLDGGTGADNMTGGVGNDTYYVDNASDTITEAINGGSDRVFSSASYRLWEQSQHIENLILTGTANIDGAGNGMNNGIVGNAGNNLLDGGNGNDILLGGAGNDRLIGGGGNDTMTGGTGVDTFVFLTHGEADVIADFQNGVDLLEIGTGVNSLAQVTVTDVGADTVLQFDGNSLTLKNFDHALISADDFSFV